MYVKKRKKKKRTDPACEIHDTGGVRGVSSAIYTTGHPKPTRRRQWTASTVQTARGKVGFTYQACANSSLVPVPLTPPTLQESRVRLNDPSVACCTKIFDAPQAYNQTAGSETLSACNDKNKHTRTNMNVRTHKVARFHSVVGR